MEGWEQWEDGGCPIGVYMLCCTEREEAEEGEEGDEEEELILHHTAGFNMSDLGKKTLLHVKNLIEN